MKLKQSRARRTMIGLAAAVALAAGGTAAVAAGTTSHGSSRPAAARESGSGQAARARASLVRYLSQTGPFVDLTTKDGMKPATPNLSAGPTGTAQDASFNWSGYADTSSTANTFTAVSATWQEPVTLCTPEQRLASFWVGLDGYANGTVEQDGTLAYCFEGKAYYYTWWEMFPAGTVEVGATLRPGDLIHASVTRTGTSYTLAVTDYNDPSDSFSTSQTCTVCTNTSAEWIAERPEFPIGITPLTYFSDWGVSRASQTSDSVTGSIAAGPDATRITMIDATSTYPLAIASGLSRGGSAFTAHWLNSY
jgi:peptidase A4-like protein